MEDIEVDTTPVGMINNSGVEERGNTSWEHKLKVKSANLPYIRTIGGERSLKSTYSRPLVNKSGYSTFKK